MENDSVYQQSWIKFVDALKLEGYTPTGSDKLLGIREQQIDDEIRDSLEGDGYSDV